jgi:hypothetical protein
VPEDEFVPCRSGCETCKPGVFKGAGAAHIQPTSEPYPVGPSVEPYAGRILGLSLGAAIVDEAFPPPVQPRPVPRRPLDAGLTRRLFP